MEYLWAISSAIGALSMALMFLTSEYFKQNGVGFLAVIRSFTALTLLPFVFFVEWPKEPLFYLYGAVPFLLYAIGDILLFRVSAKYGAGVLTRFLPLTAIITFLLWFIVDSETLHNYIANPVIALGIAVCLIGVVFSASFLRHCKVSMEAFKTLSPMLILMPTASIMTKLALDQTELPSAVLINLFVGSFVTLGMYGLCYRVNKTVRAEFSISKVVVKAGLVASVFSTLLIYFANVGNDLSSNPSYVTAVSYTSAIWVLLIYKIIGKQDNARILPGLGIVIFTALLVILSGRI